MPVRFTREAKFGDPTLYKLKRSARTPPLPIHQTCKQFYSLTGAAIGAPLILDTLILLLVMCEYRSFLDWYDLGLYGPVPSRRYITFPGSSPELYFAARNNRCDRDLNFLAPGARVGWNASSSMVVLVTARFWFQGRWI